jgi:hypothetical protein
MTLTYPGVRAPVVRDLWSALAASLAGAAARHPRVTAVLRRLRAGWCWLSPIALVVAWFVVPQIHESIGVYVALAWVLVLWFWLARTKTVSLAFVTAWYGICILWSAVIAVVTTVLADALSEEIVPGITTGGGPGSDGASIVIAGIGEESLKVLPLAVFALCAARRAARWSAGDVLLLGVVSGLAFQTCEDVTRRLAAHVIKPGLLDILAGVDDRSPASGYAQYSLSPLSGWSIQDSSGAEFAGHHVFTGLVAGCLAVAVMAWRATRRRGPIARLAGRAMGTALPLAAWWLVAATHAGYNAGTTLGAEHWLDSDSPVPWLLRAGFTVTGGGRWLGAALIVLLAVALYTDAGRRRRFDDARDGRAPTVVSGGPRVARWFASVSVSLCLDLAAFARYTVTDIGRWARAHRRLPGESGFAALARGRGVGTAQRVCWGDASVGADADTRRSRITRRALAGLAIAALLAAVLLLAPRWAGDIPDTYLGNWLAGLFDSIADWWNKQSLGTQLVLMVGVAALITLSGGSFAVGMWSVGLASYLAGHGHGVAALIRNPRQAVGQYLAHATPAGVALDLLELGLTVLPAGIGSRAGLVLRRSLTPEMERQIATRAAQRAASPVVFRSADDLVGPLANDIERAIPGRVVDVNTQVLMHNGLKREIDIELDDLLIQVKNGNARGLTGQLIKTAATTGKQAIGYAPGISDAAWRNAAQQGVIIARNPQELIAIIRELT